jgi:hypothetical protein
MSAYSAAEHVSFHARKLSFFRQSGLQKMCQPYMYVWKTKGLEGRIALLLGGGFFLQCIQQEERFPYKPSSEELGERRSFGINCLKNIL